MSAMHKIWSMLLSYGRATAAEEQVPCMMPLVVLQKNKQSAANRVASQEPDAGLLVETLLVQK